MKKKRWKAWANSLQDQLFASHEQVTNLRREAHKLALRVKELEQSPTWESKRPAVERMREEKNRRIDDLEKRCATLQDQGIAAIGKADALEAENKVLQAKVEALQEALRPPVDRKALAEVHRIKDEMLGRLAGKKLCPAIVGGKVCDHPLEYVHEDGDTLVCGKCKCLWDKDSLQEEYDKQAAHGDDQGIYGEAD